MKYFLSLHTHKNILCMIQINRACHLTNDVFVISTNYAQFIHIHWKGHVELTCQLNLKNKAPLNNNANPNTPNLTHNNSQHNSPPVTPSTPNDNPNVRLFIHHCYRVTPGEFKIRDTS